MLDNQVNILGAGAIGLSIYSYLNNVTNKYLITNNNNIRASNLIDPQGIHKKINPSYFKKKEIIDFLFICTKTYNVIEAITEYKKYINANCLIVLCQNGAPEIENIQQTLPNNNIAIASCLFGAKIQDRQLILSNQPTITLCPVTHAAYAQTLHLSLLLQKNNIDTNINNNINKVIYEKLIINASLNALGAIYKKSHIEIFKSPKLQQLAKELCFESTHIINKKTPIASAEKIWQNITNLISIIGTNHSSMLQDINNNKPTEIDAINGHIIQLANQYNMPAKLNQQIVNQIKDLYAN